MTHNHSSSRSYSRRLCRLTAYAIVSWPTVNASCIPRLAAHPRASRDDNSKWNNMTENPDTIQVYKQKQVTALLHGPTALPCNCTLCRFEQPRQDRLRTSAACAWQATV